MIESIGPIPHNPQRGESFDFHAMDQVLNQNQSLLQELAKNGDWTDWTNVAQELLGKSPVTRSIPAKQRQQFVAQKQKELQAAHVMPTITGKRVSKQSRKAIAAQLGGISSHKVAALRSASLGSAQPVNENVIKVDGVSYVLFYDPSAPNDPSQAMAFPISQTAAVGAEGGPDFSSTEAIWYTLQNAYNAGDKLLFQQTMNAYLFLVNQKEATIAACDQSNYGNQWAPTPGLAGWTFDLGIDPPGITIQNNLDGVTGAFPYVQNNVSDQGLSSATDADEQIINMMIQGYNKWGDLKLHCWGTFPPAASLPPGDPALPAPILNMNLSSLLHMAVTSFTAYDVSNSSTPPINPPTRGGFTYDGVTYYPVLTNDNWGHNVLNPSYADFGTLANIYNYMQEVGTFGSAPQTLVKAVQNTMKYLQALQKDYGGGLPDNPTWPEVGNKPTTVGWDSIRFLSSSGMYIYNCNHKGFTDPFGILDQVENMTKTMLGYVWSIGGGTGKLNNGSTLNGAALYGPMLVAMKALNLDGNLPSNIPSSQVAVISQSLDASMTYNPDNKDPTTWQKNYYAVELYLVNRFEANSIPSP